MCKYFFRADGEDNSFFQEAHVEAIRIFSSRRPHWRPRKVKSASLFLSIFFLIEKEIADCDDEIVKELYVEVFGSRDDYIDLVMESMDKVDEVESLMVDGSTVRISHWTGGNLQQDDDESNTRSEDRSP